MKKRGFLYIFALLAFLALFMYWQNSTLEITRYVLSFDDLPESFDGFRIVQISDMHGKTFGNSNAALSDRIKSLEPDIVLATGDMMSSTIDDGAAFLDFLAQFDNTSPVYMCLGNHEQIALLFNAQGDFKPNCKRFLEETRKQGVTILDNEKTALSRQGDVVYLWGLTPELYHYSRRDNNPDESLFLTRSYIEGVLGNAGEGFNILMAHNPAYFKEYKEWGADLILSGHVHGGIIRVPFKGGLLSPEHLFFPEYDAGLFEEDNAKMIVNRGLGYSQIKLRLFNRPEISFIELKRTRP